MGVGGPVTDPNMTLGLFSQSYMNPPTFSLSFNVSNGPPTIIRCYINDSPIHHHSLERMIVNGSGSVTAVSVLVTSNQTGTYTCTVSNDRVLDGTINGITATNSTTTLTITSEGTMIINFIVIIIIILIFLLLYRI